MDEKFDPTPSGLMKKFLNVKSFYMNAELNCRKTADRNFNAELEAKEFVAMLRKVEKKKLALDEKFDIMAEALVSYSDQYFYDAEVSISIVSVAFRLQTVESRP